ncbi:MAG: hypothetical protein DHS20C18_53580 [Saprospiraceae bacterium]|nr:MAG: hypothetical protein DHS20C18_53580 [Saprospiraceae bacterium]
MKKTIKASQMAKLYTSILLITCFSFCQYAHAQTLKTVLIQYVTGDEYGIPEELLNETVRFGEIANLSQPYLADSLVGISLKTYALLYSKTLQTAQVDDRRAFIHLVLDALNDGTSGGLAEQLIAYLPHFHRNDFDVSAKEKIEKLLEKGTAHFAQFVKIAGFVLEDQAPFQQLLDTSTDKPLSRSVKESVYLALARNGNPSKLDVVQRSIRTLALGDDFIYYAVPVIIYVRQKGPTDYLLNLILQNDQACTPADAETTGNISCAYRLLEMVAPVIVDFPLEVSASGDLAVDDYPAALEEAREWIKLHRDNYQLRRDLY